MTSENLHLSLIIPNLFTKQDVIIYHLTLNYLSSNAFVLVSAISNLNIFISRPIQIFQKKLTD